MAQNKKTTDTPSTLTPVQEELNRRKEAAATACRKHDGTWRGVIETLVDNYGYIESLRRDVPELKVVFEAAGVKLTVKRREKPTSTMLNIIYPETVRQRISEWASALEIAHKLDWSGEKLRDALIAVPLKSFKKTYDPRPPKVKLDTDNGSAAASTTDDTVAADVGALGVVDLPAVGSFAGRIIIYADALGDGRINITRWVRRFDDDDHPELGDDPEPASPAPSANSTGAGHGGSPEVPPPENDGTGKPPPPLAHPTTAPMPEYKVVAFAALRRLIHTGTITTLQSAADALNAGGIKAAWVESKWHAASVRSLIMGLGYERMRDVPPSDPEPHDDPDDHPDPPPADAAPMPSGDVIEFGAAVRAAAATHNPDLAARLTSDETAEVMVAIDAAVCDAYRTEERFDGIRRGRNWPVAVEISAERGQPSLAIIVSGRPTPFAAYDLTGRVSAEWSNGATRPRTIVEARVFVNTLQHLAAGPDQHIRERGVKGDNSSIDTSNAPAITILASNEGTSIITDSGYSVWLMNERLAVERGDEVPEPAYCWLAAAA